MLSDDNGCLCNHIQQSGQPFKLCIACHARSKSKVTCKKCGIGLFAGDEEDRGTCSNCYYNDPRLFRR